LSKNPKILPLNIITVFLFIFLGLELHTILVQSQKPFSEEASTTKPEWLLSFCFLTGPLIGGGHLTLVFWSKSIQEVTPSLC
jgi:hypothetical protein